MLRILLHWLIDFLEVIGFVAAILLAGLAVAIAGFWTLSRVLSLFGVDTVNSGPYEFEDDDFEIGDYDIHDRDIHDHHHAETTQQAASPRTIAPSSNDPKPPSH